MVALSLAEDDLEGRASQPPDDLAHAVMASADRDRDGKISRDEFAAAVRAGMTHTTAWGDTPGARRRRSSASIAIVAGRAADVDVEVPSRSSTRRRAPPLVAAP